MTYRSLIPVVALAFVACGGGEQPASSSGGSGSGAAPSTPPAAAPAATLPPPPTGPMTMPDWFSADSDAGTVHITITAGLTPLNNHWNMNGAINGDIAITVPQGSTVTIDQINADPVMAHSLGVSPEVPNFLMPPTPTPVFPGAITENPTSMVDATLPGQTETIQFVPDEAGHYLLVCYIPGHTAVGMWLHFNVSADGQAGVQVRS